MYEWTFRESVLPLIEFHDDTMHGEEQVVVWLLKSLCDGVQFALVTAAVVRLRLAQCVFVSVKLIAVGVVVFDADLIC